MIIMMSGLKPRHTFKCYPYWVTRKDFGIRRVSIANDIILSNMRKSLKYIAENDDFLYNAIGGN